MKNAWEATRLSGLELANAFIKSATYEGMYTNGLPTQDLIDHHVAMARGGVGLTTVSYAAVSPEARTFKDQMHVNDKSLEGLKQLVDQVHDAGGKASIQLTHCGYFSKNTSINQPFAPSRVFNEYGFLSGLVFSKAMEENDLKKVINDFVEAAYSLKKIGFDALEIHMGHGYLLSQFLSPSANKRKDKYGGSIQNRARFPLEVFDAVRKKMGEDYPLLVKLNINDGIRNGFNEKDCIYVAKELEKRKCSAIVLSGGFTSKSPFYLLRGDVPLWGMIKNGSNWAEKLTMALFGPVIIKKYNFKANFFLAQAKQIRKEVSLPLVYLGGVDSIIGIEEIMQEGFDFIALARPLIHDSNFLLKLKEGEITQSACNRCNQCIVEMDKNGVRCVL